MPALQPFVPNALLQLPANLVFNDPVSGLPVTQLLPVGITGTTVADNRYTGFISCVAAALNTQIDLYAAVNQTLVNYNTTMTGLQNQITALQISGTTVPNVQGYCFTSGSTTPITTLVPAMANSICQYNNALGQPSDLLAAVAAEGASTLNGLAAYSQAGLMSGLAGWNSNPLTLGVSMKNLWLAHRDMRSGVNTALQGNAYDKGSLLTVASTSGTTIPTAISNPSFVNVIALNSATATVFASGYYFDLSQGSVKLKVVNAGQPAVQINFNWISYK